MAIFLGAISLRGAPLAEPLARSLQSAMARAGDVQVHQGGSCAIAYVDLGIWPGASSRSTATEFAVVAADPVLCEGSRALRRGEAIDRLMQRVPTEGSAALRDAEGTFAGLIWSRQKGDLYAFTDKMGVRPLYWAQTNEHLFIASTFWALQALPELAQTPDWRGAAETAAFGFPLGNRTLVEQISALAPGHCLHISRAGVSDAPYWSWEQLPANKLQGEQLIEHIEAAFHDAMDRRMQGQSQVMAFLSGGMDSRLIAARLREQGLAVHSLNFAPPGSQDLVFGRLAAERLGCKHFEYAQGASDFGERQTEALQAWRQANPAAEAQPDQPGLIWSGDGGSVGLGHVYLTKAAVQQARASGLEAAARLIQAENKNVLSPRVLRARWRHLADTPLKGIVEDLQSRAAQVEAGRNCHLFFMLNDQRRHLVKYFETLHIRRVDLVLPFFDARFIAAVLSSPVDDFLEHRLYNALMSRLPMRAGEVPWQAYPGHQPCPIPVDGTLRRQWQDGWYDKQEADAIHRAFFKQFLRQVMTSSRAAAVISRTTAVLVAVAGLLGFKGRQYLAKNCLPFLAAAELTIR